MYVTKYSVVFKGNVQVGCVKCNITKRQQIWKL